MARRTKQITVDVNEVEDRGERLLTQHIDYIAQPGRNITSLKTERMDQAMTTIAGLIGGAYGFDVVNIDSERH